MFPTWISCRLWLAGDAPQNVSKDHKTTARAALACRHVAGSGSMHCRRQGLRCRRRIIGPVPEECGAGGRHPKSDNHQKVACATPLPGQQGCRPHRWDVLPSSHHGNLALSGDGWTGVAPGDSRLKHTSCDCEEGVDGAHQSANSSHCHSFAGGRPIGAVRSILSAKTLAPLMFVTAPLLVVAWTIEGLSTMVPAPNELHPSSCHTSCKSLPLLSKILATHNTRVVPRPATPSPPRNIHLHPARTKKAQTCSPHLQRLFRP